MAITKITRDALNTGIDDNSDATAITIDSSEDVDFTGTAASRRLQVGKQNITQAYPGLNAGYVADFQGDSSSGQTYISIAAPNVASLGSGGVIIGEDQTDAYVVQRANKNLKLATSDLNRVVIDGAGNVTMPSQPFWQAEHPTNQTFTVSANSYINHTNVTHNVGSHVNSSGTFTAPVAGVYGLWWKSIVAGTHANMHVSFLFSTGSHAGSNYHFSPNQPSNYWQAVMMGGYYYLPQGCTVRVYNHAVSWTAHGGSWSQFGGYLVG